MSRQSQSQPVQRRLSFAAGISEVHLEECQGKADQVLKSNNSTCRDSQEKDKDDSECLSSSSTIVMQSKNSIGAASITAAKSTKILALRSQNKKNQVMHQMESSCSTTSLELPSQRYEVEEEEEEAELLSEHSSTTLSALNSESLAQLSSSIGSVAATVTLHEIVADVKSGVPSIAEERLKQEKALKKRKLSQMQSQLQCEEEEENEEVGSSSSALRGKNITSLSQLKQSQQTNVSAPMMVVERRHTSLSFCAKKLHTKKWAAEETTKFYKSLQIFGTDFSLISKLFPERTRIQIKNKFRKEERENSKIVEEQLRLNSKGRFNRVQTRLAAKKAATYSAAGIAKELPMKERVELLLEQRKKRLLSFESVDDADIEIAEEFNDIFEKEMAAAKQLQIDAASEL